MSAAKRSVTFEEIEKSLNLAGRTLLTEVFREVSETLESFVHKTREIRPDVVLGALLSRADISKNEKIRNAFGHAGVANDAMYMLANQIIREAAEEFVEDCTDDNGVYEHAKDGFESRQQFLWYVADRVQTISDFKL